MKHQLNRHRWVITLGAIALGSVVLAPAFRSAVPTARARITGVGVCSRTKEPDDPKPGKPKPKLPLMASRTKEPDPPKPDKPKPRADSAAFAAHS